MEWVEIVAQGERCDRKEDLKFMDHILGLDMGLYVYFFDSFSS